MPKRVCDIVENHFLSVPFRLEQLICLASGKFLVECSNLINGSILARLAEANLMKSHLILATLISTLLLAISDIWSSGDNSSSRPLGGRPRYIQPDRQQNRIHHQFSLSLYLLAGTPLQRYLSIIWTLLHSSLRVLIQHSCHSLSRHD